MSPRTFAPAVALALFLASEPHAFADNGNANVARAESLFREARDAMAEQDFLRAKEKLEASQRLQAGAGTLLNLAYCYERLGLFANAYREYQNALALAEKTKRGERVRAAREKLAELSKRVGLVTVIITRDGNPTAATTTTIDGISVTDGNPIPLEEGRHVLRAVAPGYNTWSGQVLAKAGDRAQVIVPVLAPVAKQPSPMPSQPLSTSAGVIAADDADERSGVVADASATTDSGAALRRHLGIGLAAAGVAGVGVGIVLGLGAKAAWDESSSHCNDRVCDPYGMGRIDHAKTSASWATIVTGAGLAAAAGGVLLIVTNRSDRLESARIAATPTNGGMHLGLSRPF